MITEKTETKDLLVVSENFLAKSDIFTLEGIRPLVDKIKSETSLIVLPDTSTAKNRDEIKAVAYMITRSKTLIEEAGKKKNEEGRKKIDIVNQARKFSKDELTTHAAKIRQPVTDWEEAEKEKKANEERVRKETEERVKKEEAEKAAKEKRDREEAERVEKERVERKKRDDAAAEERRQNNTLRRKNVQAAALKSLMKECGINLQIASEIVSAIDDGLIENITINY